ncbi:MAG: hypothetical protein J6U96_02310 [Elusimicrobiaceae bacterium]|nr:hypothetical protein [Elusimicrobiaceae bacterium]
MKRKKRSLFVKALLGLTLVSVVPVFVIGFHVLRVDSRILQHEILDKQHTLAHRMASAMIEEVSRTMQFLSVFAGIHSDFETHPDFDQQDFDYVRKQNPEISYVALADVTGRIRFFSGKPLVNRKRLADWETISKTCVIGGQDYIGSVRNAEGGLSVLMGFPVRQYGVRASVDGVLVAEMSLAGLNRVLNENHMQNMTAFVVAADGSVVSYSEDDGVFSANESSEVKNKVQAIARRMQGDVNAQIKLEDGSKWLVSKAEVPLLGWTLFIEQPANVAYTLLQESTFHSLWDVLFMVLVLAAFIVAVAYWVLAPIVRPVKRLQEVAVRFEREDDYEPSSEDLIIPNNEIGELCRVFLHMAAVLRERKNALLSAQHKLLSANEELEERVQQRGEELEKATTELVKTERLAAIGQMASIISHEIRNPLAVISNATKLIKTIQPPTEPKLIKQFAIIDAEIRQANGIISEVLGFARSRDMILSVIDLNSYVHDIVASYPVGQNIHVTEDLDVESARLKVDAEEMKQALRNLISNACESMPQGGTVTVGTRVGKHIVCIFVADEGPGITPEMKEQIFSPFFTTKARGTGLGLAVVHKAVMRHKGKILVHNRAEKGSVFEIYLKIYAKTGDTRYG